MQGFSLVLFDRHSEIYSSVAALLQLCCRCSYRNRALIGSQRCIGFTSGGKVGGTVLSQKKMHLKRKSLGFRV